MKDVLRSASRSWSAAMLVVAGCTGLRAPAADDALPRRDSGPAKGAPVPWSADPISNPFLVASPAADTTAPVGVRVVLADAAPRALEPRPAAVARPIGPDEAEALLARLAGPAAEPEPPAFRFPARSMPAPRPGTTTRGTFPGPESAVATPPLAAAGPLRAVHTAPHGDVATASQVSIRFSRPMVPIAELGGAPPGVRLSPPVPGGWRWLDPQTLVFEAAGRLPKATHYTVDVPAGLVAADGERLGEPIRWTFTTPAPAVVDVVPLSSVGVSPVLVLVFDQRVDPAAVLPFLRLEVEGRAQPLRLATDDDLGSWDAWWAAVRAERSSRAVPDSGQLVAVRADGRLPPSQGDEARLDAVLRVLPGLPSLEGPERSRGETERRFVLAPGFGVVEHGCGRAFTCWPGVPWTIRLSEPLGPRPDSGSWVRVDPPLPGATLEAWNDHLVVLGSPEPGRTYTVWLDSAVASWSGARLGPTPPLRFSIGRPPPALWMPGGGITMIPPAQPARLLLLAEGVDSIDVEVRAVDADHWPAYERALDVWESGYVSPVTPLRSLLATGKLLRRQVLPVTPRHGGPGEVWLDLDDALDASGHAFIIAEPVVDPPGRPGDGTEHQRIVFGWVQRSALQLDVHEDRDALTVYATSVETGRPLRDVRLVLNARPRASGGPRVRLDSTHTNPRGLAVLGASLSERGAEWWLTAELDGQRITFPARLVGDWPGPRTWAPELRAYFVTDRPIYEPGDTVRFAGWLRRVAGTGREPARPEPLSVVRYQARDPRGALLAEDSIFELSPNGRIEASFVLPAEANSGTGFIGVVLSDSAERKLFTHSRFDVEEARRPNFDVSVELEPGPLVPGESVQATARARYFTGGAVPDAEVRWTVGSTVAGYSPPGVTGYDFGRPVPVDNRIPPGEHTGRTDGTGEHRIRARIESVQPDVAMNLTVEATAVDLDRQERTARANVLVHPANVYVGLRAVAPLVRAGEPLRVEALVVDVDGQAVAGRPVTVRAIRQDPRSESGGLAIDESERAHCALRSSAEPVPCTLGGLPAGDYVVVARVVDDLGRRSTTDIPVRVAGETIPSSARAARETVTIEAGRAEYEPGDTAVVSIAASFPAVEALLSVRRGGMIEAQTVQLDPLHHGEDGLPADSVMDDDPDPTDSGDRAAVVRLPIRDAHVPSVHLAVAAHAADGTTARSSVHIQVAPTTRELDVHVTPNSAEVAPGATTTLTVTVKDPEGRPVPSADVVLSGVDEALLALSRAASFGPLDHIYHRWDPAEVVDRTLRTHVAPPLTPSPRIAQTARAAPTGISSHEAHGPGTLEGVVIDGSTGAPIGGAWIEASGAGGTWTRINGSYRLERVPAGDHRVIARADGYVSRQVRGVTVEPGAVARANVVLLTVEAVLAGGRSLTGEPLAARPAVCGGCLEAAAVAAPAPPDDAAYRDDFGMFEEFEVPSTWAGWGSGLRRNLSPVAAFEARAVTGEDGRVEIPVEMPDNLTRYRIRAFAAKDDRRFGSGESTVTVRRPLIVRPSPPRFLNQGDRFELPVLVENRSGGAIEVDVAVRGVNAEVGAPAGRRVVVPPEDRVELRFPATAGLPGTARFQVAAEPSDRRARPNVDAHRAARDTPPPQPSPAGGGSDSVPRRPTELLPPTGGGREGGGRNTAAQAIADAVEVAVPVFVPAVPETFAVYGELDDATPVGYPVRLPESSLPGQARVELGFSTTAAHGLSDALWFLAGCPYELPEVWASRILALTALRDAPAAAPWQIAAIDSAIIANVRMLARSQLHDGGWSLWTARFDADPFVTVHAAHALARAAAAGLPVPERVLAYVTHWLALIDPAAPDSTKAEAASPFPIDYPLQARHAVQAYALDVRRRLGEDASGSAAALLDRVGARELTAEALAWLLPALAGNAAHPADAATVLRELDARMVRSAGTAGIVSPYDVGGRAVLYSPRRTDAVVLAALVEAISSPQPGEVREGPAAARGGSDSSPRREEAGRGVAGQAQELAAALARGLMAHRVRGRWTNTQENAFAVAALARFVASAEAEEPAFRVRAWAGRRLAGEHAFVGRSDERHEIVVPADSLGRPGEDLELVLAREGAGRLYYRVGISYAPAGATPAVARGFEIGRVYEAVDDPDDVRRGDDGTWRVRRGARVRIRLTVAAPGPRYHVAVIDPLPAGLEAINPALAGTTGAFAPRSTAVYGPPTAAIDNAAFRPDHVNVKADRFEAFRSRLEPGRREIVYYALATTPGDFAAPAPRAEEMYAPETFGRGDSERLIVEASNETTHPRP